MPIQSFHSSIVSVNLTFHFSTSSELQQLPSSVCRSGHSFLSHTNPRHSFSASISTKPPTTRDPSANINAFVAREIRFVRLAKGDGDGGIISTNAGDLELECDDLGDRQIETSPPPGVAHAAHHSLISVCGHRERTMWSRLWISDEGTASLLPGHHQRHVYFDL